MKEGIILDDTLEKSLNLKEGGCGQKLILERIVEGRKKKMQNV